MTQLQIVKRNDKYVVQIRRQRFFTRRWYWIDLSKFNDDLNNYSKLGVHAPKDPQPFETQKQAETHCMELLLLQLRSDKADVSVKTYNTNLHDMVWPRCPEMPECKEVGSSIKASSHSTFEILPANGLEPCPECGYLGNLKEAKK